MGGFWGTVCDMYSWAFGRKGATVVCRQLGMKTLGIFQVNVKCNLSSFIYSGKYTVNLYCKLTYIVFLGAIAVGGAYFGEGSGPVSGYINCGGTESNLVQCSWGSVGQRDCHHGRDMGVICQGSVGLDCCIAYKIFSDLIVTLHQHFNFMARDSMQILCTQ